MACSEPSSRLLLHAVVTDATLTPNQDCYWIGGPGRSSGKTTFSWQSGDPQFKPRRAQLYLTTCTTHPSQLETSDVIWPRSIASDLRSPTHHLRSLRFSVSLATTTTTKLSPLLPGSGPFLLSRRSPFSDLPFRAVDPSVGGKPVTDATLTLNQDCYWIGGPGRSSGISTFSWQSGDPQFKPRRAQLYLTTCTTHPSHSVLCFFSQFWIFFFTFLSPQGTLREKDGSWRTVNGCGLATMTGQIMQYVPNTLQLQKYTEEITVYQKKWW